MKRNPSIAIGSDHGGFEHKEQLKTFISSLGYEVRDCGTYSKDSVDYPIFAFAAAQLVASGECSFGIVVDGAGIGSAMAANKVQGARAAACYNTALAKNSREHNDANILTLGAGQTNIEEAKSIAAVFLGTECTEDRHKRRVRMIEDIEQGRFTVQTADGRQKGGSEVNLSSQDVERIADRVRQLIAPKEGGPGSDPAMNEAVDPATLAQMIDHTILRPDALVDDIRKLCEEAVEHNFFSVCVNSSYVRLAKSLLKGSRVKVCAVVGFPLGAQPSEIKAMEARRAIREGASEIDMVINIGALKSGDYDAVLKDVRAVVEVCRDGRALSKVILETALLSDDEKIKACEISMKAHADYVKTSTGFSSGGATAEDIELMARTVAPRKLGVKASGGVRTFEDAMRMIAAGATRIGSSNSVKLLEEAKAVSGRKERTNG